MQFPATRRSQAETVIIAADSSRERIGSCRETPHREISRRAGACSTHMKASLGALLAWMVILAGCVGPGAFESPKVLEYLDGNYRTLASCTHQQLARQYGQLRMTDLRERRTVTIGPPQGQWEFSFIDDDGGRQTLCPASTLLLWLGPARRSSPCGQARGGRGLRWRKVAPAKGENEGGAAVDKDYLT
jgi:hypothetical protein